MAKTLSRIFLTTLLATPAAAGAFTIPKWLAAEPELIPHFKQGACSDPLAIIVDVKNNSSNYLQSAYGTVFYYREGFSNPIIQERFSTSLIIKPNSTSSRCFRVSDYDVIRLIPEINSLTGLEKLDRYGTTQPLLSDINIPESLFDEIRFSAELLGYEFGKPY